MKAAEATARRFDLAVPTDGAPEGDSKKSFWSNLGQLLRGRNGATTLLFWVASFGGLLLVYGVSTWLPKLMVVDGFETGSSLMFLVVINLGGVFGLLVAGRASDAIGPVRISGIWFLVTGILVTVFGMGLPLGWTYVVVFAAGFFLFSAQSMVYAAVAHVFPLSARASAIGWTTGMGRFGAVFGPWMGGQLLAHGLGDWGFVAFGFFGVLSMVALVLVMIMTRSNNGRAIDYAGSTGRRVSGRVQAS